MGTDIDVLVTRGLRKTFESDTAPGARAAGRRHDDAARASSSR